MKSKKTMGRLLSAVYVALAFLFLYAPILILIYRSFDFDGGDVFGAYKEFFAHKDAKIALFNTVIIAVLSAVISTIIGTAAAVGISKYRNRKLKRAVMLVTNIPMTSPDIVMAISLVLLFGVIFSIFSVTNYLGFYTLLIAHITFEIPYVILSVLPKINQMDKHLPEAAKDLGCTPFQAFFKVELPAIKTGVFTGFFMAFTLSIDDYVITKFLSGTTFQTLPVFIANQAKKGIKPYVYAMSTIVFVAVLVILIVKNIISNRDKKNK